MSQEYQPSNNRNSGTTGRTKIKDARSKELCGQYNTEPLHKRTEAKYKAKNRNGNVNGAKLA